MYNYIVPCSPEEERVLLAMLKDKGHWASGHCPPDVSTLIKWVLEDAINDYKTERMGNNE